MMKYQGAGDIAGPFSLEVTCSETDLLTSSVRLRGISSLAPQQIRWLFIVVQRGQRRRRHDVSQFTVPTKF